MGIQRINPQSRTNGLAVTSLILGILAWVFALALACLNWVILPIITVATMGAGGLLYICTLAVGCLSPLGWLIGTILGYSAKNQIKQAGEDGAGLANAGLILNAIGLGLTILGICGIAIYTIAVGGLGFLDSLQY